MGDRPDEQREQPPVPFDAYWGSVSTTDDTPPSSDPAPADSPGAAGDEAAHDDGASSPVASDDQTAGSPLARRLGDVGAEHTRRRRELDAADLIRPPVATTTRRRWWRRSRHDGRVTKAQAEAIQLVARIREPIPSPSLIAVASTKGGVGKTTSTLMIGNTLAAIRDDRAVALDANPDAGSLARRIARTSTANAIDLLDLVGSLKDYYDLRHFTSMVASGLEVIAAADDPRDTRGVSAVDTDELLTRLRTWYPIVLADCGTGTRTPSTSTILDQADALVVVTSARLDAAQSVDHMLTALEHRGLGDTVRRAVVAVNAVHPRSGVDAGAVVGHFRDRVRTAVAIPWDPELARGGIVDVAALAPATRHAHALLAVAVLDGLRAPRER